MAACVCAADSSEPPARPSSLFTLCLLLEELDVIDVVCLSAAALVGVAGNFRGLASDSFRR